MADITTDDDFIYTDGGDEVSSGPKASSVTKTSDLLVFFLDPTGGFALDYTDGVG